MLSTRLGKHADATQSTGIVCVTHISVTLGLSVCSVCRVGISHLDFACVCNFDTVGRGGGRLGPNQSDLWYSSAKGTPQFVYNFDLVRGGVYSFFWIRV